MNVNIFTAAFAAICLAVAITVADAKKFRPDSAPFKKALVTLASNTETIDPTFFEQNVQCVQSESNLISQSFCPRNIFAYGAISTLPSLDARICKPNDNDDALKVERAEIALDSSIKPPVLVIRVSITTPVDVSPHDRFKVVFKGFNKRPHYLTSFTFNGSPGSNSTTFQLEAKLSNFPALKINDILIKIKQHVKDSDRAFSRKSCVRFPFLHDGDDGGSVTQSLHPTASPTYAPSPKPTAAPTPENTAAPTNTRTTGCIDRNTPSSACCSGDIEISSSITSIAYGAFERCMITSVVIPDGITSIGDHAFNENFNIVAVTIPNSVQAIGKWAFRMNQILSVNIPHGLTTISENAFSVNQLSSVTIPSTVTIIEGCAFCYNRLTGNLSIPDSVVSIGNWAFSWNGISSVVIPDSVTSLSGFNRNALTSITIPSSVTSIGDDAFEGNYLTSVAIPSSVVGIGSDAFGNNPRGNNNFCLVYLGSVFSYPACI